MNAPAVMQPPPIELGVGAGAALLLTGLIGFGLAEIGAQPLGLHIYGDLDLVDTQAVSEIAAPALQNGFFMLDSDWLERELGEIPWVHQATVERLWPDRVAVHLTGHKPWAHWGEQQVLTMDGELLDLPGELALPLTIEAPTKAVQQVVKDVRKMQRASVAQGFNLLAWQYELSGDATALLEGADGTQYRIELGRDQLDRQIHTLFATAVPVLAGRIEAVSRIDLRYRNGFAVGWRQSSKDSKHD